MHTLNEAREFVRSQLSDGVTCLCCEQLCQAYVRKLNLSMLRALVWLVHSHGDKQWAHIDGFPMLQGRPGGGDFAKLAHWGLIKQQDNDDPSKRTSGYWKASPLALRFVSGEIGMPSYVVIYNNEVLDWSEEMVWAEDLIPVDDFHYQKMLEDSRNRYVSEH